MKNKSLKTIIKLFIYPFLYLFRAISYLIPRNNNIWVFGSAGGLSFTDNAKYLLLYIIENSPEVRPVWISKNKEVLDYLENRNIEAYSKYSFKGILYALIGKIHFYNHSLKDINFWTSATAIKVNLWHGTPMKKIEFDIKKGGIFTGVFDNSLASRFLYPAQYTRPDYMLSTSKKVSKDLFSSAFRIELSKFLEFGYPRNEVFSYTETELLSFVKKYELSQTIALIKKIRQYDKAYIYMPTFRDTGSDFIKSSSFDFEKINNILKERNQLLILKFHHMTTITVDLTKYENILLFNHRIDIYPILPFTHCLITDYSSIYFDYKLMKKQVIFFCFDKDKYLSEDREMYFNYDTVIKNELVANNFNELLNLLINKGFETTSKSNPFLEEMIFETSEIQTNKTIVDFFKLKLNF